MSRYGKRSGGGVEAWIVGGRLEKERGKNIEFIICQKKETYRKRE